jgi:hypothetical protein
MQPAGRDPELLVAPGTITVPLRSRSNASHFWIILLQDACLLVYAALLLNSKYADSPSKPPLSVRTSCQ